MSLRSQRCDDGAAEWDENRDFSAIRKQKTHRRVTNKNWVKAKGVLYIITGSVEEKLE